MSKHTPGPWVIGAMEPGQVAVDGANGEEVTGWLSPEDGQLIAAAPELLEDLREAAKLLRRYETLHRAKNTEESTAKAEVNAGWATRFENTIAKATGGTL